MNKKAFFGLISFLLLGLVIIQAACNQSLSSSGAGPTPTPVFTPTLAPAIIAGIDTALQNAVKGHVVYAVPAAMQYEQTAEVQLTLSPIITGEDLKKQIFRQSLALTGDLEITPLMKAELMSADMQAFTIQPFHDSAEQVIIAGEPTQWRWSVTARKPGDQVLTLTLYRQIQYNGQMYWRMVETYENNIQVSISARQRFVNFDWKWLAGILLTAMFIPAFWRLIDREKKKKKTARRCKSK
jgi:hypothetical protein